MSISDLEYAQIARENSKLAFGDVIAKYHGERLPPESTYVVEDRQIPADDGSAEITVRIVRPTAVESYPVLVWFHGGGWVMGDLDLDDANLRSISVELKLAIVNVNYRHAPEHKFPVPFDDAYAAVKWVVNNAEELRIATDKGLLVGGDSAGANLAAAVALKARDDAFFAANPITGQYLREPAVIHQGGPIPDKYKSDLRSWEEHKDSPGLSKKGVLKYFELYGAPQTDLRFAVLLAPSHAGLPPAFIQVNEIDPIRDDGIVYEKALREAGVPTKLILNPGVPHGFYYAAPAITAAKKVDRDARDGLNWLLSFTKKT
ncbi:Alpha/Beta hydrolase protein [Fomes fomentarius]|nr:Alpha/Beta hydrolase protein [Fomes fomentarius]